jgi:dipeptide/tripeptide permease
MAVYLVKMFRLSEADSYPPCTPSFSALVFGFVAGDWLGVLGRRIGAMILRLLVLAVMCTSVANDHSIISVNWLILSYALQSIGELMIFNRILATVDHLVLQHLIGFIMGSWVPCPSLPPN